MTNATCPDCDGPMKERTNRSTGEIFLGCSDFPKCRGTRPLDEDEAGGGGNDEARLPSERMAARGRRRWEQDA